ncbi:IQ and ubiquitin-like domain-containing protein [Argiope bruennichi]|uniref:IQ and ubiquitin-like domain-containing protein n=1 Tax=Argiope bruennichi TaxID=94029 RepID=UPI002494FD9E|nr:IQ and ubiquitin-like domain-containing protein [Argiope bruennichi]
MFKENSNHLLSAENSSDSTDLTIKNTKSSSYNINEVGREDTKPLKTSKKPFLGGYRNKLTGQIFHHAFTQTRPSPWKYEFVLRFNRDAQTVEMKDKSQQTPKDASTQVQARNIYLSIENDKILETTNNYIYADEIKKEYLNKIITLQKYIRSWLAFRELLRRKKKALLQILWDKEQIKIKRKEDADWLQNLEKRKLNPKTADDFRLIFSDLQKWLNSETKSISEVRSGADCKAAMWLLVNSEVARIEDVNKKKDKFEHEQYIQRREKFLEKAAKSKMWKASNDTAQVHTGTTLRATYLHDLYQTLSTKYISVQDRVDALKNLKAILKPYHSKLTDNLIQLANREIDLHIRGIKNVHLEGLQNRIRNLFWQFAKKPVYNPEMQLLTKMKKDDTSSPYIMCCSACKSFYILPINSTDEILGKSVIENYFTKCKKCLNIENEAWIRKDLELYKRILRILISEEEKKSSKSSIIYILRPSDIGYLVEKIWKHQSCLSCSKNDLELELTRFNMDKNWTPWNCLLVTRQEANVLSKIPESEPKYDKKFKMCVSQKHAEARKYFATIPRFLPYLVEDSDASLKTNI